MRHGGAARAEARVALLHPYLTVGNPRPMVSSRRPRAAAGAVDGGGLRHRALLQPVDELMRLSVLHDLWGRRVVHARR